MDEGETVAAIFCLVIKKTKITTKDDFEKNKKKLSLQI